jgi:hypothetical protein
VVTFAHSFEELHQAQEALSGPAGSGAGLEVLWSSIDVMQNHVELGVVVSTPGAEAAVEADYGNAVELVPALTPVS